MKKTALITLLLGMVVFSSAFAAGGTFGVSGGLAKPTGDFGDLYKMGFQGGVFAEIAANPQFAIGVGVDYVRLGASDEFVEGMEVPLEEYLQAELYYQTGYLYSVDATFDSKFSIVPITFYAKWMPAMQGSVLPYIKVGGGYYMMTVKMDLALDVPELGYSDSASESTSESKPGFFGGVGIDFKASPAVKVGVFAEMHNILTEGESLKYYNMGVSLGFGSASN